MNPYEIKGPYNPNPPKPQPKKRPLELGMEQLMDVGHIIAVASGKGGVGKSTVAVNLAVTLARMGYKVGLADADVYGPSIPKMTGTENAIPEVEVYDEMGNPLPIDAEIDDSCKENIVPIEKYGVKWMSIGYFARPEQALIWRGPISGAARWPATPSNRCCCKSNGARSTSC